MAEVILVTGGSRGIGRAVAILAAERGYDVAINYNSQAEAAEEVARLVRAKGRKVAVIKADVGKEEDVVRLFKEVDRQLGRLTALVNNAGIVDKSMRVEAMSGERLQRMFATNTVSAFLCAREAIRRMSKRHGGEGGAIVNVSSIAARVGGPGEFVDYAASKGALDSFTIGLAKEVGPDGIRVNAVRPGIIETDIHAATGDPGRVERIAPQVPLQRAGSAAETADVILWLLSPQSSYVTGALVDVSGGR
ncbi:MAG: SDR family oxidoreductase [Hyphomicrobiaceae bacterium]|nr:MAG: SDR family oxidoreductase [Hyphomicrobiaceae bacterium]